MGSGYLQRYLLICSYLKPQMFFKDLRLYTILFSGSFIKPTELKTKMQNGRKGSCKCKLMLAANGAALQVQSRAQIWVSAV